MRRLLLTLLLASACDAQALTLRLRCIAQLKSGEVDGLLAAFLPERMAYGVFPMAGAAVMRRAR